MLALAVGCMPDGQQADVVEPAIDTDGGTPDPSGEAEPSSGGDFLPPPDAGAPAYECDIWAHDCPTSEKCMPYASDGGSAWSGTRCSPIAIDPAVAGEPCHVEGSRASGLDDCDLATMCWDVDPVTNEGTCVPMCVGAPFSPLCEDPNHHCLQAAGGFLNLCLPTCNPLLQDCRQGRGCYGMPDRFICTPDASGNALNEPCEYHNVCSPGLQCLSIDGPPCPDDAIACCRPFCRLGEMGSPCAALEECVPWFDDGDAPARWEDVGYCALLDL